MIKVISAGGSLGAVVVLIYYMIRKDKLQQERDVMFNTTLNNHFDHNTKAYEKMSETHKELMQTLERLSGRIEGCPHNKLNN